MSECKTIASARSEINTDRKRDSPERLVDGQTREVKVGEIFLGHHLTELITAERSRRVGVTRARYTKDYHCITTPAALFL